MKTFSNKKRISDKGFTLVELIVVLVILAILAAILVPALLGYIDRAKDSQYMINAKNMLTATQAKLSEEYAHDNSKEDLITNNWKTISKDIIKTADDDPFMCIIGVGKYETYKKDSKSKTYNPHKAYTVYFVAYWADENSSPIFFNGSEWSNDYPWSGTNANDFKVNGEPITMKFHFVSNHYKTKSVSSMNEWEYIKFGVLASGHRMAKGSNVTGNMINELKKRNIKYEHLLY